MTTCIDVPIHGRHYQVIIGVDHAVDALLQPLALGDDIVLIYDAVFDDLDAGRCLYYWQQALGQSNVSKGNGRAVRVRSFAVASGEGSKSLRSYADLCEQILASRITRDTVIVALGGGVIGDLAGFLAATLLRGLRFVQIPTTLLAQVDSSVGGKVGINARTGKNLIGAFHQPCLVLADLAILQHLPNREFAAGMAEVLKAGLLADRDFWFWLERNADTINARDIATLETMIARAVQIKADVVLADETERTGGRALLNLGHTFGHALEAKAGYAAEHLIHGEAVAIGMVMAARLSSGISVSEVAHISDVLRAFNLPVTTSLSATPKALYDLMLYDKKADQSGLKLVLLEAIGQAKVYPAPSPEQIMAVIAPSLEN